MNTGIFHTVNAGLYLWGANTGILVDGLHRGKAEGFSITPPKILHQMEVGKRDFSHPLLQGMLFTHLHPDHFNGSELAFAVNAVPSARVYIPGFIKTHSCESCHCFRIGDSDVVAIPTTHDGSLFEKDPHCSFLITVGEECFFIAGDAFLEESLWEVISRVHTGSITGVFLNLYQLASPQGQAFLRCLEPERVFLYHLPFPEDDTGLLTYLAKEVVRKQPADLPPIEILEHMAWVDGNTANWPTEKR